MWQSNLATRVRKLFSKKERITEKCVVCGVDTGIPNDLIIDFRMYYVEGAGQMCHDCWDNVYKN